MECPFVFSSSAEIPVFCPREQCPLHVFSLERTPAGPFIAWRFSGHSRKVTPLTLVCHKTPARHSFFFFSSPLRLSFSMYISYFILFIYFSFILSHIYIYIYIYYIYIYIYIFILHIYIYIYIYVCVCVCVCVCVYVCLCAYVHVCTFIFICINIYIYIYIYI